LLACLDGHGCADPDRLPDRAVVSTVPLCRTDNHPSQWADRIPSICRFLTIEGEPAERCETSILSFNRRCALGKVLIGSLDETPISPAMATWSCSYDGLRSVAWPKMVIERLGKSRARGTSRYRSPPPTPTTKPTGASSMAKLDRFTSRPTLTPSRRPRGGEKASPVSRWERRDADDRPDDRRDGQGLHGR